MRVLMFFILISSFLFAADASKGLTYYKYIIRPIIEIKGSDFSKQHTALEWKVLFKNGAKGFKENYSHLNSEFKTFLQSEKFDRIEGDLREFLIIYAKDQPQSAQCAD